VLGGVVGFHAARRFSASAHPHHHHRPTNGAGSGGAAGGSSANRSTAARPVRVTTNPATSCGLGNPLRQPDNLAGRKSGMQAGGDTLAGSSAA
jgi:hypothetical protein